MDEVSLAARRSTPLSPPTAALLARLFPSADSISVAAPSADGLGLSVAALLPRRQAAGCQQAQLLQHAEPLPGSGLLLFSLTAAPTHAECQLVHAFASELGARLLPRRNSTVSSQFVLVLVVVGSIICFAADGRLSCVQALLLLSPAHPPTHHALPAPPHCRPRRHCRRRWKAPPAAACTTASGCPAEVRYRPLVPALGPAFGTAPGSVSNHWRMHLLALHGLAY